MGPSSRALSIPKRLLFSSILVTSFFALVEIGLWAAGARILLAGRDPYLDFSRKTRVFREDRGSGFYVTTEAAASRSFNAQRFRIAKPPSALRLFVLGGSSAWGFPWGADVAFPRVLGDALQASWPDRTVEAINAAAMSYGSQRMRVLAHEIADHRPDVVIVFEGHNEFVEDRFDREVVKRRAGLGPILGLLGRWRLFSVLSRFTAHVRGAPGHAGRDLDSATTGELLGLDVAREDATGKTNADKRLVCARFEENLRAIVGVLEDEGCLVVLSTVPSNVRDWTPNQSLFEPALDPRARADLVSRIVDADRRLAQGDAAGAAKLLEQVARASPGHAETQFRLGQSYEALSRWREAHDAYARARDLDAQPARALADINQAIRRVAAERGTLLVDCERAFEEASPHGLVGFGLIEDYVHPKPRGHWLIARELFKAIEQRLRPGRPPDWPAFERTAGKEPPPDMDPLDSSAARSLDPARTATWLYNLGVVLEHQGLVERAMEKFRSSLELDPGCDPAAFNLGRLLSQQGRNDLAEREYRRALAVNPDQVPSLRGLGLSLLMLGRPAEAEVSLVRAIELDDSSRPAWTLLGQARAVQGNLDGATDAWRRAADLEPGNPLALYNLGAALRRQGRFEEAIRLLRASLAIFREDVPAQDELADALVATGKDGEAAALYAASLRADPNDKHARDALAALAARGAVPP